MWKYVVATMALAGIVLATGPVSMDVSATSVTLVPAKPIKGATAWVTNTAYAQGAVVTSGGSHYFTPTGGTTTNIAPTNTVGDLVLDGITWRYISPNKRNGLVISLNEANDKVNLSFGSADAVATNGCLLTGQGATWVFDATDNFQGAVQAISFDSTTNIVGVQEW